MKESSWNDCIEENSAIKISPDRARTKSLIETADERIKLITGVSDLLFVLKYEASLTDSQNLMRKRLRCLFADRFWGSVTFGIAGL